MRSALERSPNQSQTVSYTQIQTSGFHLKKDIKSLNKFWQINYKSMEKLAMSKWSLSLHQFIPVNKTMEGLFYACKAGSLSENQLMQFVTRKG